MSISANRTVAYVKPLTSGSFARSVMKQSYDKTKTQYSENLMKEYTLRIPEDIVRSTKWTLFIEQPDAADSNNVE